MHTGFFFNFAYIMNWQNSKFLPKLITCHCTKMWFWLMFPLVLSFFSGKTSNKISLFGGRVGRRGDNLALGCIHTYIKSKNI